MGRRGPSPLGRVVCVSGLVLWKVTLGDKRETGLVAGVEGLTMMARYKMALGISLALYTQNGMISCPRAAPKGFARLASAVAATRPRSVNHRSEYLVGAARTKGWAKPMRSWPNMTTPKLGGSARTPP